MKKFGFYFGLISVVFSCHIKNKTSNKNLNSNFLLQGFQSGELVRTNIKTNECHFLIRINNEKELLDPINLSDFKHQEFGPCSNKGASRYLYQDLEFITMPIGYQPVGFLRLSTSGIKSVVGTHVNKSSLI